MKYYITTPEIAKGASAIKAQRAGCSGSTAFWWQVIDHPTGLLSAVTFSDDEAIETELGVAVTLYTGVSATITTDDIVDTLTPDWFPT